MGPGYFSRACDGLAPSVREEPLGAWLNDGWTVGAAPESRWSRSSKSSSGCPTRSATVTRAQYPTPLRRIATKCRRQPG